MHVSRAAIESTIRPWDGKGVANIAARASAAGENVNN
jgi:hypothetical protein